MKNWICSLVLVAFLQACSGVPYQKDKPLSYNSSFGDGRIFKQDDKEVKYREARSALADDPKTSSQMSTAMAWDVGGLVVASAGGYMFGYGLGTWLRNDGHGEPIFMLIGAATFALSFVFSNAANHQISEAVDIHNAELKPQSSGLNVTPSGLVYLF